MIESGLTEFIPPPPSEAWNFFSEHIVLQRYGISIKSMQLDEGPDKLDQLLTIIRILDKDTQTLQQVDSKSQFIPQLRNIQNIAVGSYITFNWKIKVISSGLRINNIRQALGTGYYGRSAISTISDLQEEFRSQFLEYLTQSAEYFSQIPIWAITGQQSILHTNQRLALPFSIQIGQENYATTSILKLFEDLQWSYSNGLNAYLQELSAFIAVDPDTGIPYITSEEKLIEFVTTSKEKVKSFNQKRR